VAGSRRVREVERVRLERQAARRAAARARARRRNARIGAVLATVLVVAAVAFIAAQLRGSKKPTTAAVRSPSATPSAAAPSTPGGPIVSCVYSHAAGTPAAARNVGLPGQRVDRRIPYAATMVTNRGTVRFSLRTADAPCTTNAFRYLASKKYFDKTPCHRLTTTGSLYVLQCGDPTGTGSGGPGFAFNDENLSGATYPAGTVAMANSGPNTNGSQFFLVYKDSQLPPSYTPFGQITAGLDVLSTIAAGGSAPAGDGKPKLPVTIETLTVTAG